MAKSFIDVVQDSPRSRLCLPVKTKNPLSRTNTPPTERPFSFKLHGRLVPAYSRPGLATKGVGPDAISTGPPRCFAPEAHRASLSSSSV